MKKTKETIDNFIDAYIKNRGIISDSCFNANISYRTYYDWIDEDIEFKNRVVEADEVILRNTKELDKKNVVMVENALVTKALKGNPACIFFFLKNLYPSKYRDDYQLGQIFIQNQRNNFNFIQTTYNDMPVDKLLEKVGELTQQVGKGKVTEAQIVKEGVKEGTQ